MESALHDLVRLATLLLSSTLGHDKMHASRRHGGSKENGSVLSVDMLGYVDVLGVKAPHT